MTKVTIDGITTDVAFGTTILEAAGTVGGAIPTLCFDERLAPFGACRVCLVGVEGSPVPVASCTTPCREGMVVTTDDQEARRIAAAVVALVLSELPHAPAPDTELAEVARTLGVEFDATPWNGERRTERTDDRHPYLVLRDELCISCGRCVRACDEIQGTFALTAVGRGFRSGIAAGIDSGFAESACVSCGACADTCPTGAITEPGLIELELTSLQSTGGG